MSLEELAEYADDTYAYVEDTYMQADDLAEHAVPSPPAYDDGDDTDYDLWQYDYWMDIDYGSDGDEIRNRRQISRATRAKRKHTASRESLSKRRKGELQYKKAEASLNMPVVYILKNAVECRLEPQETPLATDTDKWASWALLKDWRAQFQDVPMWNNQKPNTRLPDVQYIVDDDEFREDTPDMEDGARHHRSYDDAEVWEDEEDGARHHRSYDDADGWEDEEDGAENKEPVDVDSAIIRMALREKLNAAGVSERGVNEDILLQMAMQMLNGNGGSGDMAGDLAAQLLGGRPVDEEEDWDTASHTADTGGESNDFAKWVKGQAEASLASKKGAISELPTPVDSVRSPSASPSGKLPPATAGGESAVQALQSSKSAVTNPEKVTRKRKADKTDANMRSKRPAPAKQGFDASTTSSKARALGIGREQ